MLVCFVLFAVLFGGFGDAVPVTIEREELNRFVDPWDYRVDVHEEPLLGSVEGNHSLPPVPERLSSNPNFYIPPENTRRVAKKLGDVVQSKISCPSCRLAVGLLQKAVRRGGSFEEIKNQFVGICVAFKIQTEIVCSGVFDLYGPEVLPVLGASEVGPVEICSLALGEACGDVENPTHEWSVTFPDKPKPKVVEPPLPTIGSPTFKVLHLSDTHFDPEYMEGSHSVCEEPLCCREYSSPAVKGNLKPAGRWGSYGSCDSPRILIESMLQHIVEEHQDIDYIIWTGDLPPHDIWNQTKDSNLDIMQECMHQMFEAFPNVPIFPALGNHEAAPSGNFAPPWMRHENHSVDWLYEEAAYHWSKWLPSEANNTVLHGGFYSVLVRPGFRVISMNMNYCHSLSWWLFLNSTDPAKELQWLIYELQQAEDKGEKVHIIGHIPPGATDCMKVWSRNYYQIIERYEKTIKAQFFGHTHADEFAVFYDSKEHQRPTSVAFIGPSVTPYENFNPAYRLYYVDGEHKNSTYEVLDHETWITNLEAANSRNETPGWFRLYSAKEAYSMSSLRPQEWNRLIDRLILDEELFDKFYRNYYRDSPARPDCKAADCVLQIICDLKSGKSHERRRLCRDLELIFSSY